MRLGISSYAYTWAVGVEGYLPDKPMGPLDLLRKTSELGVRVLQVIDNMPLHQFTPQELDSFEHLAGELDIEIEVGTRGIAPDHLRTYLRLAERLNSGILRVVVDTADHQPDDDEIVEIIRAFVPDLKQANIRLAIENHDRFPMATLTDILDRIDSEYVGVCLDTVNSFGALHGPEIVVEALGFRTFNLHVKDFLIRRMEHMMGFLIEGQPAGQGRLNIPWLLDQLKGLGCECNAILELWTPPQQTIAATVAMEEEWARTSIAYLRTLIPD